MSHIDYCVFQNNHKPLITKIEHLDPTRRFKVTVTEWKSVRTLEQNALIWKFFTDFGAHVGYEGRQEIDDLKSMVTFDLHPVSIVSKIDGNVYKKAPQTSKMNTKEFSELMEKCIRYAAGLGFYWEGQ